MGSVSSSRVSVMEWIARLDRTRVSFMNSPQLHLSFLSCKLFPFQLPSNLNSSHKSLSHHNLLALIWEITLEQSTFKGLCSTSSSCDLAFLLHVVFGSQPPSTQVILSHQLNTSSLIIDWTSSSTQHTYPKESTRLSHLHSYPLSHHRFEQANSSSGNSISYSGALQPHFSLPALLILEPHDPCPHPSRIRLVYLSDYQERPRLHPVAIFLHVTNEVRYISFTTIYHPARFQYRKPNFSASLIHLTDYFLKYVKLNNSRTYKLAQS